MYSQIPVTFEYPTPTEAFCQTCVERSRPVKMTGSDRLIIGNNYFQGNYPGAIPDIYCRLAVAERCLMALASLDDSVGIYLFDGFRTIETQTTLYDEFVAAVREQQPLWSDAEVVTQALNFVSHPTDTSRFKVPLHNTGGAIDLTLIDMATGEPWDMGTEIDEISELSYTDYFERDYDPKVEIPLSRWLHVRQRRRILFHTMIAAGFVNFSHEWWHYDIGDSNWAQCLQREELYSSMESLVLVEQE